MRHAKAGRRLGRTSAHRQAMYRNMVTSLLEHGRIRTTELKAKELRRYAEKTISKSLRLGDLLDTPVAKRTPEEQSRVVHAMRMAGRMVRSRDVLRKLFEEIAPRMRGRPGGYTRIVKVGRRVGDAAPMAIIELVA